MFSQAKSEAGEGRRWPHSAELPWQGKSFCFTASFLICCYRTRLTRSTKVSALRQRAGVPYGMEKAGRLRHRQTPCTPWSPPCSWLSPGAFWHPTLQVSLKKKPKIYKNLHPFQALQATAGQDQLMMSSLGSRYKLRQKIFPNPSETLR